jgi:iron complex transport system substrate-binding protein
LTSRCRSERIALWRHAVGTAVLGLAGCASACAADQAGERDAGHVRIVSLAPNLTSLAFAAGAGSAVVGTVEFSDEPEAARSIPRVGDAFRVDLERLTALAPDLVLAWESGTPTRTIDSIRQLGFPVESIGIYRLADVAPAIRRIGALAGTSGAADVAANRFEQGVAAIAPHAGSRRLKVFIEVDDRPLYTVNGRHIISELVDRCGGHNVFADLGEIAPVVDLEAVIGAEPEVIFSTDDTVVDPAGFWARWPQIPAAATGNIYSLPADEVAQSTTRLLDGLRRICRLLDQSRMRQRAP